MTQTHTRTLTQTQTRRLIPVFKWWIKTEYRNKIPLRELCLLFCLDCIGGPQFDDVKLSAFDWREMEKKNGGIH